MRIAGPILLAGAAAGLVAACLGGGGAAAGDLRGERRAALARLVVDNRTGVPLAIAFLYAAAPGGPGGEVGVGTAPPDARTELAPVPADEPIVLIARGPGFELRLEPRTLEIDQVWTWIVRPEDGARPEAGSPQP